MRRDDVVHGNQEDRFFHGYYDHYCFLPAVCLLPQAATWSVTDAPEQDRRRQRMKTGRSWQYCWLNDCDRSGQQVRIICPWSTPVFAAGGCFTLWCERLHQTWCYIVTANRQEQAPERRSPHQRQRDCTRLLSPNWVPRCVGLLISHYAAGSSSGSQAAGHRQDRTHG